MHTPEGEKFPRKDVSSLPTHSGDCADGDDEVRAVDDVASLAIAPSLAARWAGSSMGSTVLP